MAGRNIAYGHPEGAPSISVGGTSPRVLPKLMEVVRAVCWWLRQVFGDAAYENYVRRTSNDATSGHQTCDHVSQGTVSEEEFYLDRLRRKHNTVNRCC